MTNYLVFLAGVAIGYWLYYWRMFFKLYKVKKNLDEAEKIIAQMIMETRDLLEPNQWNEDKL